jgi:xanthine dehydrogenase molybdenum-binding subunit
MAEVRPWLWEVPADSPIGKRHLLRKDGFDKASGKTPFVGDIVLPGMLYAKGLTSPYCRAEITKIDASKALALEGVWDVLLYDDPDIKYRWENTIPENDYVLKLLPNVAEWYSHVVGAIVTAESEEICDRAIKLLDVTWKELDFVLDQEEAMEDGAPAVWTSTLPVPEANNIHQSEEEEEGDVEAGFAESDNVIEFRITREENNPGGAEPSKALAQWTGGKGTENDQYLEAWVKSQVPHHERACLSDLGYVSSGRIEVNCPYSGGTFGGLNWLAGAHMVPQIAAICSHRTGRPVQYIWDESNFYCVGDEYGTYDIKVGFNDDGMINAVQCKSIGMRSCGVEKIEETIQCHNLKAIHVYPWVSRPPRMCWRDGGPPSMVGNEVYSHVAAALNMQLPDLAIKNYGLHGGRDITWINEYQASVGMPVVHTMKAVMDEGKAAIGWDEKWHEPGTKKLANGKYHGIGVNYNHHWAHTGYLRSYIGVTCIDGVINILGRWGDIGTGRMSSYCAIVAAEIGAKYEDVVCRTFKQQPTAYEMTRPGGSFGLVTDSPLLVQIAQDLKQQILVKACSPKNMPLFSIPIQLPALFDGFTPDQLDIKDSVVYEKANPSNSKTLKEVSAVWMSRGGLGGTGAGKGDAFFNDAPPLASSMNPTYPADVEQLHLACQAQFIEVEVDPDTGKVDVTNVVTLNDVGTVISPEGVNGQQYGGCIMGIEKSLSAEKVYDPATGVWLNDNHVCWGELTSADVGPIDCHILENKQGYGAYGLYGCSETPCANTINLTGSAVYNAIGKFVEHYPQTPEKILKVLGKA